eukprot:CAMPEP_0184653484 /NCGR_PEP_ID=MMETSP0308-20130426/11203_1 /TAXON_ID=38269 /ORGANISM="Gloeochaete witrockiana, Strain SAG 46.84" /LENGTH=91 /DNA_ID=CAMNT_0027088967 /DNA_START=288 /DNA_END=559 /DNA_ORIENTATION=-
MTGHGDRTDRLPAMAVFPPLSLAEGVEAGRVGLGLLSNMLPLTSIESVRLSEDFRGNTVGLDLMMTSGSCSWSGLLDSKVASPSSILITPL